jgi:5-methyltetrahydrofolate--homocysteine methyltransferase
VGGEARKVFDDGQALLKRIVEEKLIQGKVWLASLFGVDDQLILSVVQGVFGLFPANTVDVDDIEIYEDETRDVPKAKYE